MAASQEVLGILVSLEGKTRFIAGVREEQAAIKGYSAEMRTAAAGSNEMAAADAKRAASVGLVNRAMKGLGLILVGTAVESIKMSTEFNRQLEMIHTQAGASVGEVNRARAAIKDMRGGITQSPTELAMGLFHLESIGLRGAKALDALHLAAQGATVGNADLEQTTTALGAAWLSQIKGGGNLNQVMATMNATVGQGNLRMNELVEALGTGILPSAKLAGLSLQDVMAALAVLKDEGYPASSAMAQLATALHFLYAPTKKATTALEGIGLTQEQIVTTMHGPDGLHATLELLSKHLNNVGNEAQRLKLLGEIFPGGRGRVLLVLLNQLDRLDEKQKNIGGASSKQFNHALKDAMETPAIKMKEAWSNLQKEMVSFGETMEGPAAAALTFFAGAGIFALKAILALTADGKLLIPIVAALTLAWLGYKAAVLASAFASTTFAVVQGGLMLAAVAAETIGVIGLSDAFLGLAIAMDANPVGAILLAITALGLLIYHFRSQLMDVVRWIGSHWRTLLYVLIGPFAFFVLLAVDEFKKIKRLIGGVASWLGTAWSKVGHILAWPFEKMWQMASWVFKQIKTLVSHIPGLGLLEKGAHVAGSVAHFMEHPHFAHGGVMPYSGLATINENGPGERVWLPGGSTVQPSPASSLQQPRAHTPNPTTHEELPPIGLEAVLVLPNGDVLADLTLKHLAIKKSRQ
jgi:TP901 family phage tail tape measure protein